MTPPKIERVKSAGSCCVCGSRFYAMDKIRIVQLLNGKGVPLLVKSAMHQECWKSSELKKDIDKSKKEGA